MKQKLNYCIDVSMIIAFLVCGVSGILKMPEINIPFDMDLYARISILHDWSGVIGLVLAVAHVALHARWLSVMTKNIVGLQGKLKPVAEKAKTAVALFAILFVVQSNTLAWAGGRGRPSNATVPQGINYPAGNLKDGTYTGTANGYMPSLTVEVVIKSGKISSVKIVSHQETMRWYQAVVNVIPNRIVQAQSTDVDSVSGATCSSYGILSAVENALAKAAAL